MASGSNTFGGTIKLSGETEYRKALSNISAQLGVVSSELNKVSTQYGKNDTSMESTAKKSEILNNKLSAQKERVEVLKQALEKSKEMYGENDTRTLKWQQSLNNAEADVVKTTKEIENLGKELQDSGEKADSSANGGYTIFKNVIANLATDAIESALSGLKKLGSAMLDVGKQALNSYADYEQLVGGVETLFKDSAGVVENYANNAYKTAGLSANEYMETVTSFSASLLQSLGNDTSKSAEYADRAIIDMSDNANKMGTDMSMIQSAYQGFAKQNYTMLDNLKLGYGGTKTEMQRLIDDANKVKEANGEMANLSIESFADITEAIHIIQDEMGITGTTAKEASETISGSIGSMKSSWQNLLTGLANGNADINGLINNLVDSVITACDNILPVVDQIAQSVMAVLPEILNKIIENLPKFLEAGTNILNSLISGISQNLPAIMNAVMTIVTTIINTLVQNLPQILQMGIQIIVSLIQGIAEQLPTLIPQIIDAVILMAETLIDNIDLIIDAGIQLIIGLAEGLLNALPTLIDKIPVIIDKLVTAIVDNIPQIISSLVNGLARGFGNLVSMGGQLLGKVKDGIVKGISGMLDIGKNIVKGLWNGISNAKDWVLDKIKGFGKSVLNGIKGIFGIHSPSTVFRDEVGKNLALGLGEGFTEEMDDVNKEIQKSLPTDLDVSSNVDVNKNISSKSNNDQDNKPVSSNDTYNINIYSPEDSPSEYARQVRKEIEYMKLCNA